MPFLLLVVEGGGGGVGGYMSCCEPSRNSSSSLIAPLPSLLPFPSSFFASKVKFASPFLFIPTSFYHLETKMVTLILQNLHSFNQSKNQFHNVADKQWSLSMVAWAQCEATKQEQGAFDFEERRKNWMLTLQPSEQKRNVSKRLLPQISQMWGTPLFPALGWGLSFRNITLALFITYVWTPLISNTFCTSETLTTSWYEDLLICQKKIQEGKKNKTSSKFGIFYCRKHNVKTD